MMIGSEFRSKGGLKKLVALNVKGAVVWGIGAM